MALTERSRNKDEIDRANLTALDHHLGSDALFLGGAESQLGRDAVDLEAVRDVDLAIEAGGYDPDQWQGFAFGCGIDRLAMLFTGRETIRDVILFPARRERS